MCVCVVCGPLCEYVCVCVCVCVWGVGVHEYDTMACVCIEGYNMQLVSLLFSHLVISQ